MVKPAAEWLFSALMVFVLAAPCWAIEFAADRITRTDRHIRHSRVFYRDQMWRLDHNTAGAVSVTIVRKDRDLVWLLVPSTHQFKTLAFHSDYTLAVSTHLDGETSREPIGTQLLDGHPTTLYEVTAAGTDGTKDTYYQWVATDINLPLKLAKKNGDWMVEYRHVKIGPVADSFFQLPHRYQPLDPSPSPSLSPRDPSP